MICKPVSSCVLVLFASIVLAQELPPTSEPPINSATSEIPSFTTSLLNLGGTTSNVEETTEALGSVSKIDVFQVGFSSIEWRKPIWSSATIMYRTGTAKGTYTLLSDTIPPLSINPTRTTYRITESGNSLNRILQPSFTINLNINLLGLNSIRKLIPFNDDQFMVLAGGGVGIEYSPFKMEYERTDIAFAVSPANDPLRNAVTRQKYTTSEWNWSHFDYNIHLTGGVLIDRTIGGVAELYYSYPLGTKKPTFYCTEMRAGIAYRM